MVCPGYFFEVVMYKLGIDVGSTTVKLVLLDENNWLMVGDVLLKYLLLH